MRSVDVVLSAPVPAGGYGYLFDASLVDELVPPAPATVFAAELNPLPSLPACRGAKPKRGLVSELYWPIPNYPVAAGCIFEAKLGLSYGLTAAIAPVPGPFGVDPESAIIIKSKTHR